MTAVRAAQRWLYVPPNENDPNLQQAIEFFTLNLPLSAPPFEQCGRAGLAGFHAGERVPNPQGGAALAGDVSAPLTPFPEGCQDSAWSAQAKALAYLFFELQSCTPVFSGHTTPVPPAPPPRPPPAPPPVCAKAR